MGLKSQCILMGLKSQCILMGPKSQCILMGPKSQCILMGPNSQCIFMGPKSQCIYCGMLYYYMETLAWKPSFALNFFLQKSTYSNKNIHVVPQSSKLRQIGVGVSELWSDIRTKKQRLLLYIY